MQRNQKLVSAGGTFVLWLILLNAVIVRQAFVAGDHWYACLIITVPPLLLTIIFKNKKV